MTDGKTILYVLKKSQEYLQKKNIPNSRLDAEIILSDLLGMERIKLYSNFEKTLTIDEENSYRKKIQDRGLFKPVSYITGKKMFYKSLFFVDENVLIPRPETEELIEWFLSSHEGEKNFKVLDLCCGSGCIGISLKKERPEFEIYLSDISQNALHVSKRNSQNILGEKSGELEFIESDLFENFPETILFDAVICNPPYIPISEKQELMEDVVKYEPHLALFLDNPTEFYKKILEGASNFLRSGGDLMLETHPNWTNKIIELSKNYSFENEEIKKDLSGKERFVKLIKKG